MIQLNCTYTLYPCDMPCLRALYYAVHELMLCGVHVYMDSHSVFMKESSSRILYMLAALRRYYNLFNIMLCVIEGHSCTYVYRSSTYITRDLLAIIL